MISFWNCTHGSSIILSIPLSSITIKNNNRDVNYYQFSFFARPKKNYCDSGINMFGRSPLRPVICVWYPAVLAVKHTGILFFIRPSSSFYRIYPCRHPSNVVEKYCKPHGTTSGPYKMRSCIDFGRPLFHSNHPSRLTLATHTSLSYRCNIMSYAYTRINFIVILYLCHIKSSFYNS